MGGTCNTYGIDEKGIQSFRKLEGRRPLGSPNHRQGYNIKMEHNEIGHVKLWTAFIWFKTNLVVGSCEHGDEL